MADAYRSVHRPNTIESRAGLRIRWERPSRCKQFCRCAVGCIASSRRYPRNAVRMDCWHRWINDRPPFRVDPEGQRSVNDVIMYGLSDRHPMLSVTAGRGWLGRPWSLCAMLAVVDAGVQAGCPSAHEVLAAQHARSIPPSLDPLPSRACWAVRAFDVNHLAHQVAVDGAPSGYPPRDRQRTGGHHRTHALLEDKGDICRPWPGW